MSRNLDNNIKELITRLETLSKAKYPNNVQLAKAVQCTEGAIRYLFRHKKGMTMDLFLKFCNAIDVKPDEIMKDLDSSPIKKK